VCVCVIIIIIIIIIMQCGTSHGLMSVSLFLSQVGVLSKRLNQWSWFWHGGFLSPTPHRVKRKFG